MKRYSSMHQKTRVFGVLGFCVLTGWAGTQTGNELQGEQSTNADFYVAPGGSDANPGTMDRPFATLGRAQKAVRKKLKSSVVTTDVMVLIRGGTYRLDEPIAFGPEDSGTDQYAVIYAAYGNEEPLFSGGRRITGWRKVEDGLWQAHVPQVAAGQWWFRQLFTGCRRLTRSRYPNNEVYTIAVPPTNMTQVTLNRELPSQDVVGPDTEVVLFKLWSIARVPIEKLDGVTLSSAKPMGWGEEVNRYHCNSVAEKETLYLEHSLAFVDQPGEWHLDRATGTLTLMLTEEDNPNGMQIVAPRLEKLITIIGQSDTPVQNLRLEKLRFEHTMWDLPELGYLGTQAGYHDAGGTNQTRLRIPLPVAIQMSYTTNCRLERCVIAHIGASALGLGAGCQKNKIIGCEIFDIGGNGIHVGWRNRPEPLGTDWQDPTDVPADNQVISNHVHGCGAEIFGAVGMLDALARSTRIAHNLVHDLPYTGLSIGWDWNDQPTSQRDTIVEYNHIYDVMKALSDGGGIYTLGFQPGAVMRGNLVHNIHGGLTSLWPEDLNNGLFFDSCSIGYHVEGNIVYDVGKKPLRFQIRKKEDHTWGNNLIDIGPDDEEFNSRAAAKAGLQSAYRQHTLNQ